MNIGIDLDDTITNTAEQFFKYGRIYNKEKNILFNINENEWDFDKSFGWAEENIEEFFGKYLKIIFEEVKPKAEAVETINKLKEEGHKIIIITARSNDHILDTYKICENWLNSKNVKIDKLVIDGKDKAKDCKENNIDIFIDDSIYHCENVYNSLKIPVLLMDSNYNQGYKNENIKRVFNWSEIYKEIKNKKSK